MLMEVSHRHHFNWKIFFCTNFPTRPANKEEDFSVSSLNAIADTCKWFSVSLLDCPIRSIGGMGNN